MIETMNPPAMPAPPMGLIAQIALAPAAGLAFISGQVALDQHGNLVGEGDHAEQARQCFTNLKLALDALGARPAAIAQMRIYVVDHEPSRIHDIFVAGGQALFGDDWPRCASTYLGVTALALPEWLVEIEAVVALPASWRGSPHESA